MKKIVLLAVLTIFGVTTSNAQAKKAAAKKEAVTSKTEAPKTEGAGMVFENETIDYGTLPHNADGKREFVFVNNGTKPLIITNATGSCGCTVPEVTKEAIKPGVSAPISVKFDSNGKSGEVTKTVMITCNTAKIVENIKIKANIKI